MKHRVTWRLAGLLLLGAIAGAIAGWALWTYVYWGAQSVAVINIGKAPLEDRDYLRYPDILGYVETVEFAERVAQSTGIDTLVTVLPSKEYGGRGGLSARQLRDGDQLEIRVRAEEGPTAQRAAEGVVQVLLAEIQGAPRQLPDGEDLDQLRSEIQQSKLLEHLYYEKLRRTLDSDSANAQAEYLLPQMLRLRANREKKASKLKELIGSESGKSEAEVVVAATPAFSIISSPLQLIILTSMTGFVIALLIGIAIKGNHQLRPNPTEPEDGP